MAKLAPPEGRRSLTKRYPSDDCAQRVVQPLLERHPPTSVPAAECTPIRQVSPSDDPNWDAAIAGLPGVSFFHSGTWSRVLQTSYGFRPVYFTEGEPGEYRSILPMMEVRSLLTGCRGVSLPFTDHCEPACADSEGFDRLRRAMEELARRRNWKYWEIRGGRSLLGSAGPSVSYWRHHLSLTPDTATLFANFDAATRRAVRKAEKSDLAIEFSHSAAAVRTFYRLLCKTRRRHGLPPQPLRFFENIQREVLQSGLGTVVIARHRETPVAAAVFFHLGGRVIYKFGASDETFQHLRGNNLVMWRAIEHFARQGCESLDFGRTSLANAGLRNFKLGWGARESQLSYFRYDLRHDGFVKTTDQSSGWHSRVFQHLPIPLSRIVGAMLYRHVA